MVPHPRLSPATCATVLLSFALAASAAWGADRPVPATVAKADGADPMTKLRERLAEKLGATPAPDAIGTHEMRVSSHKPEPATMSVARLQAVVNAHRASKSPAADDVHATPHWSYAGDGGPQRWADLKPEFTLCRSGTRQSPIDIRDGIAVELDPVRFDYRPSGFSVIDNGHTVQADLGPGNSIEVMGRRYELVQFHFHRPSEESVNGRRYDMSVHLVHKDLEGRIAVVAVLLERGGAQPVVQQVWNNLPLEKHQSLPASAPLNPDALLPQDRRYFTYMGSLTTPPCSEGVLWMVMKQPVAISPEQIGIFARLYPMNARPLQAASGRRILQSQ